MRITGGSLGGRRIEVPDSKIPGFRPTMDFLREVIFSSLASYTDFHEKSVLDLYAGTAIFSFESISRGASSSHIVEKNPAFCKKIEDNAAKLDVLSSLTMERKGVEKAHFNSAKYDLVFADPPYQTVSFWDYYHLINSKNVLAEGAFLIYEDNSSEIGKVNAELIQEKSAESLRLLKSKTIGSSGMIICKYLGK